MCQQKHPKKVHSSHATTPSIEKTKQFHSFINDISRKKKIYIYIYIYIYTYIYINIQLEPKFPASLHSLRDSSWICFPDSVFLGSKSPSSLSLRRDCTVLLVKGGVFLPGIFGPSFL